MSDHVDSAAITFLPARLTVYARERLVVLVLDDSEGRLGISVRDRASIEHLKKLLDAAAEKAGLP